jgi:hypothetical protein
MFILDEVLKDKILGKYQIYPREYHIIKNMIGVIIGIILLLFGLLTIITNF